jgi:hypothetical protein
MEKSFLDESVDITLETMGDITLEIKDMFKGARPFRKVKMPDNERIQNYLQWAGTPMEDELRNAGVDVDAIHTNMHDLINKKVMRNA